MADTPYVTRQEVREEAGFQHVEEIIDLNGVIDGTNKTFMTEHKPIVDRDYNDAVDVDDVTVYVDGTPVTVVSVDAAIGVIVLDAAPAEDSTLKAFYCHSQLTDVAVGRYIEQATGILHRCLRSHGIATPFKKSDDNQAPYLGNIKMIVTMYASGLALIRDYGSSADTEETSKDGYKKLETAKKEMESLCEALTADPLIPNSGNDGNGGTLAVTNQGHVFGDMSGLVNGERQGFKGRCGSPHEAFFRKG